MRHRDPVRGLFNQDAPTQSRLTLTAAPVVQAFDEKYQPTTLGEVVGQPEVVNRLRRFLAAPFSCAMLYSGNTGLGKSTTAEALAHDLGVNPKTSVNFVQIDSGLMGGDKAEAILDGLRFPPWGNETAWKVIVVDEADQWTPKAKKLWLSVLGTMSRRIRTVVIFTTNHPERFDQRERDRFVGGHYRFQADGADAMDGAQTLVNRIWNAETGGEDGPELSSLPNVVEKGQVSFRRVASAMQAVVRDGLRLKAPAPSTLAPIVSTPDPIALGEPLPVRPAPSTRPCRSCGADLRPGAMCRKCIARKTA